MNDKIKDTDTHFIIDGSTRLVKNESDTKSMLVQYDHNSERFTFRVPRFVDGHDLSLCDDYTRVHYINIDKTKKEERHGIDTITDVAVCPDDNDYVQCSWLITRNATQLAGTLHFVIEFGRKDADGKVMYSWNTAKYSGITISDGINFEESTVQENNALLEKWEQRLLASQIVNVETKTSTANGGVNEITFTFGDGSTREFKVRNGQQGTGGYVNAVETINNGWLHFFVGTTEEYNALSDIQKATLFAIITDEEEKALFGEKSEPSIAFDLDSTYSISAIIDMSYKTDENVEVRGEKNALSFILSIPDAQLLCDWHGDKMRAIDATVFSSVTSLTVSANEVCEYRVKVQIKMDAGGAEGSHTTTTTFQQRKTGDVWKTYESRSDFIEPIRFKCRKII